MSEQERQYSPALAPLDMERIRRRLLEWYSEAEAERWLDAPQPHLDGAVARTLIAEGRAAEVDRLLDRLDDCIYL